MGYFYEKKHTLIVFLPVHISLCKAPTWEGQGFTHMEMWPSGLRRTLGKGVGG